MPGNLYVDDVLITQQYKSGDILREPFYFGRFLEANEVDVTIPERVRFQHLYHKVSAVKTDGTFSDGDLCESAFSDECLVEAAETGITAPTTVGNKSGKKYTIDGRRITRPISGQPYIEDGSKRIAR